MSSISPRDAFDHVYVLSAPKNEKTRLPLVLAELLRIGVITSVSDTKLSIHYGTHPRMFDFVLDKTEKLGPALAPGWYGSNLVCSLQYYMILNEAKERGFKRILYVEDDARFLLDTKYVKESLTSIPEECDLAMLEWVVCDLNYYRSGKHTAHIAENKGKRWIEMHPYGNFVHTGAQILSKNAIEVLIRLIESGWYEIEGKLWCNMFKICDQWQDQGVLGQFNIKSFFAYPLLCVQEQEYGGYGGNNKGDYDRSFKDGLDLSKYATSGSIKTKIKELHVRQSRRAGSKSVSS